LGKTLEKKASRASVSRVASAQAGGFLRGTFSPRDQESRFMSDPYNLQRFVDAQSDVFDEVCAELTAGHKRGHWMWFIFPQLKGLGRSPTAQFYGISGREEAEEYLHHPVLGRRLRHCTQLLLEVQGRSINEIVGSPDDLKFRSCMTLFAHVTQDNQVFVDAVKKYCSGQFDDWTLAHL
jgi:uncharacterized protein (DUF1810 family)